MKIVHARADLGALLASHARQSRAVVMTMGALHAGHASLFDAARGLLGSAGQVVATVYVNPLQFNDADDLRRYPRTLDADAALATSHAVDVLWAPTADDVFPHGSAEFATEPGPIGEIFEGAARPGHFAGMLTVVRALLTAIDPGFAVFGEKDYQQLALIRQMVADLAISTTVIAAPTVRESDGLAMSSRNRFLGPTQRMQATAINCSLAAAADTADHGGLPADVLAAAADVLRDADLTPEYLDIVGENFVDVPAAGPARVLVACRIGNVRLIDNQSVTLRGDS